MKGYLKKMLSKKIKMTLGIIIAVVLVSFLFGVGVGAREDLSSSLSVFLQALDIVRHDFVETDLDNQKLIYGAIKGMLASLDDPYTRFMEPTSFKEMEIRMKGHYGGIGIYIGMKDKVLTVISPIEDTPADKAGLKSGDKIMKVDGKSTKDMSLNEAVSHIRGPKGEAVRLSILRGKEEKEREIKIVRDDIVIKNVKRKELKGKIAYIRLHTFEQRSSTHELKKAILTAKQNGDKGIILDLRNNGGGLLTNAVEIASLFIKDGPIVYTVDRNGKKESIDALGKTTWTGPLVVMVNGASASASEIVAGAIRDTKVGTVVGEKTFGKASVQNIRQLSDGSAVLLTIAKYLTPNGDNINKKGIAPDILSEIPTKELESVELGKVAKDPQLKEALKIILEKI